MPSLHLVVIIQHIVASVLKRLVRLAQQLFNADTHELLDRDAKAVGDFLQPSQVTIGNADCDRRHTNLLRIDYSSGTARSTPPDRPAWSSTFRLQTARGNFLGSSALVGRLKPETPNERELG